jgi:hypothetical protein
MEPEERERLWDETLELCRRLDDMRNTVWNLAAQYRNEVTIEVHHFSNAIDALETTIARKRKQLSDTRPAHCPSTYCF